MPPTTRRRHRTNAQVADSTHIPTNSTPEAPVSNQSRQRQSHVRKVTLRVSQPTPPGQDPHRTTSVLPPLPPHGPCQVPPPPPPPPPQHPDAAAGHPVPVSSQYGVHGPAIGMPSFPYGTPFYPPGPPAHPQLNFPYIPPYVAPFLSQLTMQQANTSDGLLPAHQVQPHYGWPVQGGNRGHVSMGDVNAVAQPDVATASSSARTRPGRACLNKQISPGVWHFVVEVIHKNIKRAIDAQTDMTWVKFLDEMHDQFGNPQTEEQLVYRIGETGAMSYLAGKDDWEKAMHQLREKIKATRSRTVSMLVKNMHTSARTNETKARGTAKGKEKHRRKDDIPSELDEETKYQLGCLLDLQNHLECTMHSTPGMKVFCWVDPSGSTRGHCEMSHQELTLWANEISRGKATKYVRPNTKKFDRPPTKKTRATHPMPVHVSVNITPTPGVATSDMQATYHVSSSSATGPLHATKVHDISSEPDTKPLSAPGPSQLSPTPRCARLLTTLDCVDAARIPSVYELLSLMDRENPTANPKYADSRSELESLCSLHDTVDVYSMPVEFLATMGKLGREGALRLHEYCRDKLFPALGIMEIRRSHSEASIEEIPPPVPPRQMVVKQEQQATGAVSTEEIVQPQTAIKKERHTIGGASVEEIEPHQWQQQETRTTQRVQPRAIKEYRDREIAEWLRRVQPGEEVEEDLGSFTSMKMEVDSENEGEDSDDNGEDSDDSGDMATVSSHEV